MWKCLPLVVLMLVAVLTAAAQTPAAPAPAHAKANDAYAKEAFVDEDDVTKISFENDGTGTRDATFRIRIQSDAGVQRYSVLSYAYQEATETIEIVYVRVRKPDGSVITTPPENYLDMPSEITRQAPFYSDLHEKHVAVKGLSAGDVLESEVRWRVTKALAPGQFWYAFNFSHDMILLHEEFQVSVPRERAVKWKSPEVKPVITEEGGRRIFTWTRQQLEHPSADEEKAKNERTAYEMARGKLPVPDIQISSFRSWEEVGAWYNGLQQERVKPSAEIRAKAAELTKNATDDDAKMRAIYNYVSQQFRYIGVAFGIGRYQPHSAADVLANQYGDCKDKHTLLASLLEAAGIKAYPALISSSRDFDPDVPSPLQFDHVITAVPRGKDYLWLDSTTEVAPFGYLMSVLLDKRALVMPDDAPAQLVTTPQALQGIKAVRTFNIDANLDDSGTLVGSVKQSLRDQDSEVLFRIGFRNTPAQQWKDLVQRISYAMGFAGEVSDVEVSQPEKTDEPWHVTYNYTRKDYPEWKKRHLTAPAPALGLPIYREEGEEPTVPVWLGPVSETDIHSQVELPKGYTPVAPKAVDLTETFAEYHATYTVKDGKLITDRRLITKVTEVPLGDYRKYMAFRKAVGDDYEQYVETSNGETAERTGWAAIRASIFTLPPCATPEAQAAETKAREAARLGDMPGMLDSLRNALEQDPKCTRDWLILGMTQYSMKNLQAALESFQKAADSDPKQVVGLKAVAFTEFNLKKYDDAAEVWRKILKLAPDDSEAPSNLGASLQSTKRYTEAAEAYEAAVKLTPNNAFARMFLGDAYLLAGNEPNAMTAYKKAMELDSGPEILNDIGYQLADANRQLPLALEYAEKAVSAEESLTANVKLSTLKVSDLRQTISMAAYWDTLGWAHFRSGNYEKAEKYLLAGWAVTQGADEAEHLGELYEKLNKKGAASRMYQRALGSPTPPNDAGEIKKRLQALGDQETKNTGSELSYERTFPVERVTKETSNADFFVQIGPGSKVEDIKFVRGSDELKSGDKALRKIDFKFPFPDDGPTKLVRRGILSCYPVTGCSFVLYNVDDVHSVD